MVGEDIGHEDDPFDRFKVVFSGLCAPIHADAEVIMTDAPTIS